MTDKATVTRHGNGHITIVMHEGTSEMAKAFFYAYRAGLEDAGAKIKNVGPTFSAYLPNGDAFDVTMRDAK